MVESSPASSAILPMVLHTRVVTGTGGGPEKTIFRSPRHLASLGYASRCAYLHPPRDEGFAEVRRKADEHGAPLDAVSDRGVLDLTIVRKLLRLCREHDVRIWHGHDYKSNALGVVLSRVWPMRLVTTVHGWVRFTKRTPLYYAVDRLSLRFFDRVICVSPDLHAECLAAGVRVSRCVLIENGIDAEEFRRRESTKQAKRRRGVPEGRLVVGAIGRLSPEKRFVELARMVQRLIGGGVDCELWIVGEGSERSRLEACLREEGLADRVKLLGYRPDVRELLQAMDVLAQFSLREGLPNAVLEAMACEVPVVATDVGGISRAIASGVNGILIGPHDGEAFQRALGTLLGDGAKRRELSRAARSTIEGRYSFRERMQKVSAVYDEVLGEHPLEARVNSFADG